MSIPGNHTLNTITLTGYTPSCGASPVAAYIRVLQKSQNATPAELRQEEIAEAQSNVKPSALIAPTRSEMRPK